MTNIFEQNRPRTTQLYPGNVTHLYKTPLYLYPNNSYTVSMTIEQDPMKVYPVFDMTTADQRSMWASQNGVPASHILPYLLQCRAPWTLKLRDGGSPSLYKPYVNWNAQPNAQYYILQEHWRDLWYAERAFRVRCDVYSGDDLMLSIDTNVGGLGAIVWHRGYHGWASFVSSGDINFSEFPCDGVHAFTGETGSPGDMNGYIDYSMRGLGNQTWQGGNSWVEFAASVDGNGKFSIVLVGAGKDIRLSCTVNQTAVHVPNGWGQNTNVTANYYATAPDAGAPYAQGDLLNTCKNRLGFMSYAQNLGWDTADQTARAMTTGQPPQTVYTAGSSFNPPGDGYDFTAIGATGEEYWAIASTGKYKEDRHDLIGGTHAWGYNVSAASPLAVGADKTLIDGSFDAMASITGGSGSSADESTVDGYLSVIDNWKAQIEGRRAYNILYQQPRIKVSITAVAEDQASGDTTVDYSKVLYCDLPGGWEQWEQRLSFSDCVEFAHPAADYWTDGINEEITTDARESLDLFSKGAYGAGEVSFAMGLNFEGLNFTKIITGSGNLGEFYEGPDDYIYDEQAPQTYDAWLTAQGL